jgi:hypothetical protein
MQNISELVVAATPRKSKTCIFDGVKVRDREVGGSNPLAPTINIKQLTATFKVAVLV